MGWYDKHCRWCEQGTWEIHSLCFDHECFIKQVCTEIVRASLAHDNAVYVNNCHRREERIMTDKEALERLVNRLRDHANHRHGHYDGCHVSTFLREAEAHLKGKEFCSRCRGMGYYFEYRDKSYLHQINCENPKCAAGLVPQE